MTARNKVLLITHSVLYTTATLVMQRRLAISHSFIIHIPVEIYWLEGALSLTDIVGKCYQTRL